MPDMRFLEIITEIEHNEGCVLDRIVIAERANWIKSRYRAGVDFNALLNESLEPLGEILESERRAFKRILGTFFGEHAQQKRQTI